MDTTRPSRIAVGAASLPLTGRPSTGTLPSRRRYCRSYPHERSRGAGGRARRSPLMTDDIVIIGAARTPQGRARGALAPLTAVQLGTAAIAAALRNAGVPGDAVDHVLMGQVLQAGAGQNPAHQSARAAGIPWSVPAMTLNKVCLSGAVAVVDAVRMLRLGD